MSEKSVIISVEDEVKSLKNINSSYDMVAISPNAKYIVGYNHIDKQIVGWNIQDIKEGKIESDGTAKPYCVEQENINNLCVSDENIVAFSYSEKEFKIIDMKNQDQTIKLDLRSNLCNLSFKFNSNNEFILLEFPFIRVYSTQIKDNKWKCQKKFKQIYLTDLIDIISDRIWLLMEYKPYIIELNIKTGNTKVISKNLKGVKTENIRISSNNKFTCLKINDEIIVYLDELNIPIASLDSNKDIRLYKFMKQNTDLHCLLLSLFDDMSKNQTRISCLNQITKDPLLKNNKTWNSFLNQLTKDNSLLKKNLQLQYFQNHLFVIVDDSVLKIEIKLDLDINSYTLEELQMYEDEENWLTYFGIEKLDEETNNFNFKYEHPLIHNMGIPSRDVFKDNKNEMQNIEVMGYNKDGHIELGVHMKVNEHEAVNYFIKINLRENFSIIQFEFLNEFNDLGVVTTIGIFIFHLNESGNNEISLKYFYNNTWNDKTDVDYDRKLINGWISYLNDDKIGFLKYGQILFIFSIKTMPLLKKQYPEYLTRYSSDTNMIINSMDYQVDEITEKSYLNPFTDTTPAFKFFIPYIKFDSYPQEYSWWWELIKPAPSTFVETISRDIYKTMNGEALIIFKWNKYGKLYYSIIWVGFIALLGCFTIAATFSEEFIPQNIRKQLLLASTILGFVHLTFEIRQFIYSPLKWVRDVWNILDLTAYLLTIGSSIYWYQTNDKNVQLLSVTCLFLDMKFLLFLRAFESFGVYFEIILSVAKRIISFLVVLGIILISFAHAFYILLALEDPWNITTTYSTSDQIGSTDPNPFIIQIPDANTNMFSGYGDSSALTLWPYKDNKILVIFMILFSFLVVVYLMNLFIGLLNIEIEKDNNRTSYLLQKANILAEIELFYLLPHQRRWKSWFPDEIYYHADVDEVRRRIQELIKNDEWDSIISSQC
ncbi:14744_t:CDS:10 [Funneliformis caledonium]|uniref:14744_t:CDS:1 n=1 Tax=Funneliformis caledonium TaxID=1117310 RepID=A0A9N8Z0V8_9GLOM|nr:14744_t:CDS:10 [Funneliformis caledonium]